MNRIILNKHRDSGFTLVEILTSISIMVIVLIAVSAFQYNVLNYNRSAAVALNNTYEAERIIKTIVKELRSMEPSDVGAYPLISAATSSVSFFSNADADDDTEQVRYFLTGTTLKKGVINPTGNPHTYNAANESVSILVTGLSNSSTTPIFEYFSKTYPTPNTAMTYPITIPSVRLIKVSLRIDTDPSKSPLPRTFSSQVQLRNLKDNL